MVAAAPPMGQLVVAGMASVLAAAYANARTSFTHDLREASQAKDFGNRMGAQLKKLGNEATLYRTLEFADSNAEALWFEGRTWTYKEVIVEVDRLAWYFQSEGVHSGDFVAVFATNSPEMLFTIYAIAKLGAVPALINATLRLATLSHCVNLAKAKLIVATPDLVNFAVEINEEGENNFKCCYLDLGSFSETKLDEISSQVKRIDRHTLLDTASPTVFVRPKRAPTDVGCLIYTSGTTGKPKAVSVKNLQFVIVSLPASRDVADPKTYFPVRTYSCLPLFHATAFFTGLCYSAGTSGSFILARKFSASRTTQQLYESRATRILYVGELCRYLLAAPPSKHDNAHKCIVAMGNGLSKDIWERFKQRFNIPEIREVYRSTEGLAKFDNFTKGAVGAGYVGLSGPVGRYLEDGTFLVRYDYATEAPYRDPSTGFCVRAKLGEPGEAIGRIRSMATFAEYLDNPKATNEKIIKDVFQKGDLFQRTGDLLLREKNGWVRFHDRTGDTFRFRGENVSAGEVRGFISEMSNVADVVVFGVKLEGYDGQMGAAGINLEVDDHAAQLACIDSLYSTLKAKGLPAYAVPRLVRFIKKVETGATFKHAKDSVKNRSWQPSKDTDGDRLFWLDGTTYQQLDESAWANLETVKAKL